MSSPAKPKELRDQKEVAILPLMAQSSFVSNSSNIASVSYEEQDASAKTGTLTVVFRTGRTYRYFEVPRTVFDALSMAEDSGGSVGSEFARLVRNGGYEYEEV